MSVYGAGCNYRTCRLGSGKNEIGIIKGVSRFVASLIAAECAGLGSYTGCCRKVVLAASGSVGSRGKGNAVGAAAGLGVVSHLRIADSVAPTEPCIVSAALSL